MIDEQELDLNVYSKTGHLLNLIDLHGKTIRRKDILLEKTATTSWSPSEGSRYMFGVWEMPKNFEGIGYHYTNNIRWQHAWVDPRYSIILDESDEWQKRIIDDFKAGVYILWSRAEYGSCEEIYKAKT